MNLNSRKLWTIGAGISLIAVLARLLTVWHRGRHAEETLDQALADSFPASDPTATQDYAIPVNRLQPVADRSA